jgi:ABC-2 type transport system ATP-binding protein
VDGAPPVTTRGLTKRFRHQVAVDSVDLVVPNGAVYGFLGPNGSGKTTTIRMLLGLIRPTAGEVDLLGAPMAGAGRPSDVSVLRQVGALVEGPAFHPYLSGRANLRRLEAADPYADPASSSRRVDAALDRVGLLNAARKRYRAYSLGMRQRLAIASALLVPRTLLVLDEPTNGLDPQGTREVRHLVSDLAADGTTVLVSSHLLSEVEQMCDHAGVMYEGRLVAQGPLAELRSATTSTVRVQTTADRAQEAAATLHRVGLADPVLDLSDGRARVTATLGAVELAAVVPALVAAGVPVLGFEAVSPSLEDVFVALTGEGFEISG